MGQYVSSLVYNNTSECYEAVIAEPTVRTDEDVARKLKELKSSPGIQSEGYFEKNKIGIDISGLSVDDSLLPRKKIVVLTHESTKSV